MVRSGPHSSKPGGKTTPCKPRLVRLVLICFLFLVCIQYGLCQMNYFRPCLVFDKMICKANQTLYEKLAGLFGKILFTFRDLQFVPYFGYDILLGVCR